MSPTQRNFHLLRLLRQMTPPLGALAAVHGLAYLVTWNFKHMLNPHLQPRIGDLSRLGNTRYCSLNGRVRIRDTGEVHEFTDDDLLLNPGVPTGTRAVQRSTASRVLQLNIISP